MYNSTDSSMVAMSSAKPEVKSEPIIGSSAPWGRSFQEKFGRFSSVGVIRPKYRRPKPNTLFQTLLYEYDRNQSAYLTSYTLPRIRDESQRLFLPEGQPKEFTTGSVILAWLSLLTGVVAASCVGSFIQKMAGVNGLLKSVWFAQGMSLVFLLSCVASTLAQRAMSKTTGYRPPGIDVDYICSAAGVGLLLLAGLGSGIGSGCWTLSLNYTSVAQSYLFNSLHPQLILLARISQLLPVFWEEVLGITLALGGCGLSFYGSQAAAATGSHVLLGDSLAFVSSSSQAIGLVISKFLLPHLPPAYYLFLVTFCSLLTQLAGTLIVFKGDISLADPTNGIFGFVDVAYLPWWFATILGFCLFQYCITLSLQVLSPIVVSIVLTLQPFLASAIQVIVLQSGSWPPPLSLAGNLILVAGSFLVCWASRYHTVADDYISESEDEE